MTCNISLKSQENADSESSELNNKLTKSFKVVHITYAFKRMKSAVYQSI